MNIAPIKTTRDYDRTLQRIEQLMDAKPVPGEGFTSYYGLPLLSKGKVQGVLELFHRVPMLPYPEWTEFLETLAGQAAIAIDNATLFKNLQKTNF